MGYGFQLQLDKGTGDLVLSGLKRLPRVTAEEKVKQDLRILLGTEHALRKPLAVTQVDEDHAAVVAGGIHPSDESDCFADV